MICGASGPEGYICTLPAGHIEEEAFFTHIATVASYPDNRSGRCTCSSCIQEWLVNRDILAEWNEEGSLTQTPRERHNTQPTFKNPPDVRTTKAARLP